MWPGDQSGGQRDPQGNTPPQQPIGPYGPPNPYAQPGYQQPGAQPPGPQQQPPQQTPPPYGTPSPYSPTGYPQPGGYPPAQQWGPPAAGGPGGPKPPRGRRGPTVAIAVTASLAVIAAVAVGAVYLSRGDKKDDDAKEPTSAPTATAPSTPPAPTTTAGDPAASGGSSDSPRGAPGSLDVEPVVPGWKVVRRGERNVAFDVPPGWTVDSEDTTIGFAGKDGNPAVAMSAPAHYKHDWCKTAKGTSDRAAVGTKGASGATSVRNAAEVQATSWAYWAYEQDGKGTFSKAQNSKEFHNAYGVSGWQAQATASGIPRTGPCAADGQVWTVAWIDPTEPDPAARLVVWVLFADRGVPDALAQATVDQIKSTIRFLKK